MVGSCEHGYELNRFHKVWGISLLAEQLVVYEQLVIFLVIIPRIQFGNYSVSEEISISFFTVENGGRLHGVMTNVSI